MIKERFMVTGKRLDNGETVTGYYVSYFNGNSHVIFSNLNEDGVVRAWYRVDPATIKPVAMMIGWDNQEAEYCCPNCHVLLTDGSTPKYCEYCGQLLDWSVLD
jgi:hypothetical protein